MSQAQADAAAARTAGKISGLLVSLVLILIVVLIGVILWYALPSANQHFDGLLGIGILGIVVAMFGVLAQALARDPAIARATTMGSFWFGIAVLIGAGLVCPDSAFGSTATNASTTTTFTLPLRLVFIVVILFLAVAGLLLLRWRFYSKSSDIIRESQRQAWRQETGAGKGATGAPSPNDPRMRPPPPR